MKVKGFFSLKFDGDFVKVRNGWMLQSFGVYVFVVYLFWTSFGNLQAETLSHLAVFLSRLNVVFEELGIAESDRV